MSAMSLPKADRSAAVVANLSLLSFPLQTLFTPFELPSVSSLASFIILLDACWSLSLRTCWTFVLPIPLPFNEISAALESVAENNTEDDSDSDRGNAKDDGEPETSPNKSSTSA